MQLRYGTLVEAADGRLVRITDRAGHVHAELTWIGDTLDRLVVDGAIVRGAILQDPLLGAAHAIEPVGTTMSAIDWARPTQIPTVADPARLPAGVGGEILNIIAHLARWADVGTLRYAGPYPTPALFRALARSFHTTADEATFTADVVGRALRVDRDELLVELTPAPCERVVIPGGWVELRDGLERVAHHGVTYERGPGVARLTDGPGGPGLPPQTCEIALWFGDTRYATIATFDAEGHLLHGPDPIPACTSDVIGREFPPALRAALAELVADAVPAALAELARAAITERTLVWADLGARPAQAHAARGFALHAALWDRIAPLGLARLALALAEALAPVVTTTLVGELAHRSAAELSVRSGP